jgi:hypothetical protein
MSLRAQRARRPGHRARRPSVPLGKRPNRSQARSTATKRRSRQLGRCYRRPATKRRSKQLGRCYRRSAPKPRSHQPGQRCMRPGNRCLGRWSMHRSPSASDADNSAGNSCNCSPFEPTNRDQANARRGTPIRGSGRRERAQQRRPPRVLLPWHLSDLANACPHDDHQTLWHDEPPDGSTAMKPKRGSSHSTSSRSTSRAGGSRRAHRDSSRTPPCVDHTLITVLRSDAFPRDRSPGAPWTGHDRD